MIEQFNPDNLISRNNFLVKRNNKLENWIIGIVIILFISFIFNMVFALWLDDFMANIKHSKPFTFQDKKWHCAYTPLQVDLNILEEKMNSLKKEIEHDR